MSVEIQCETVVPVHASGPCRVPLSPPRKTGTPDGSTAVATIRATWFEGSRNPGGG